MQHGQLTETQHCPLSLQFGQMGILLVLTQLISWPDLTLLKGQILPSDRVCSYLVKRSPLTLSQGQLLPSFKQTVFMAAAYITGINNLHVAYKYMLQVVQIHFLHINFIIII